MIVNYLTGRIERVGKLTVDYHKVSDTSFENEFYSEDEVIYILGLILNPGPSYNLMRGILAP